MSVPFCLSQAGHGLPGNFFMSRFTRLKYTTKQAELEGKESL